MPKNASAIRKRATRGYAELDSLAAMSPRKKVAKKATKKAVKRKTVRKAASSGYDELNAGEKKLKKMGATSATYSITSKNGKKTFRATIRGKKK